MSFPSSSGLSLLLAICCLCSSGRADESKDPPASIPELFDQGGTRGTGVVPGDFTILSQFRERPREQVLKEAMRRLTVAPQREFDHALAVYVLRELPVPRIGEILLQAYPKLDERGRYEVLLYAYFFRDRRFVPQFVEVLSRPRAKSIRRADLLAAGFAAMFPRQEFAPGLKRLTEQMGEFIRQVKEGRSYEVVRQTDLSGFPYGGGFISFEAAEPRTWVARAVRHLKSTSLPPSTNAAEQALLKRIRTEMLDPPRRRVDFRKVPVNRLETELRKVFTLPDEFTIHPSFNPDLDEADTELTMRREMASLSEVIVEVCNQTRFTPQPGFSLSQGFNGLGGSRFAAAGGFVVEVTAHRRDDKFAELVGPAINFSIALKSPLSWARHDFFPNFFRLTHVRMPDGTVFREQMSGEVAMGSFSIPLSADMVQKHGGKAAEIQGLVGVYVPTALRHETLDFAALETDRIDRDPLFLQIKKAKVAAGELGSWSVTRGVVGEEESEFMMGQRPKPLHFMGRVVALDKGGNAVEDTQLSFGGGNIFGGSDLRFTKAPLPHKLAWTYAPSCEFVLLPVTFKDVPLVE